MAYRKKIWVDRQVQYPNRKIITNVVTGETTVALVARDEGSIHTEGDVINADNMNDLEDRIAEGINSGGGGGSTVVVEPVLTTGTEIAQISVDGVATSLYAPDGGTDVTVNPIQTTGTKIAEITVDATTSEIYAPTATNPMLEAILSECQEIPKEQYDERGNQYLYYFTVYEYDSGSSSGSSDASEIVVDGSDSSGEPPEPPTPQNYNRRAVLYALDGYFYRGGMYILLTTYDSDNSWYVYSADSRADSYDDYGDYSTYTLIEDSGIVTNKLIYIPNFYKFRIYYYDDNPPLVMAPGAQGVYIDPAN